MALQSQSTRAGQSRKYMTSRRKPKKGPWVALFIFAVAIVGGYFFFGGGDPPTTGSEPTGPENARDTPAPPVNPLLAAIDSTPPPRQAEHNSRPAAPQPTRLAQPAQASRPEPSRRSRPLVGEALGQYEQGMKLIEDGQVIEGRVLLSELLFRAADALPRHEAQAIRDRLTHLNQTLVFSETLAQGDPIAVSHTVQRGEYLSRDIGPAFKTPHQFIMRINGIDDANRVPAGRPIKCIRGPIHAQIIKSEYRMDLYVEDPDGLRLYLCSYPVGLGEFDSTPSASGVSSPAAKSSTPTGATRAPASTTTATPPTSPSASTGWPSKAWTPTPAKPRATASTAPTTRAPSAARPRWAASGCGTSTSKRSSTCSARATAR